MNKTSLNGKWKLYYYNQLEKDIDSPEKLTADIKTVDCTVPGNVELDLSKAGILPEDLYFASNMRKIKEFETYAWWYEKEFEIPENELEKNLFLQFEGVDCIAEYFLNGVKIGESENMLIPHEFSINHVKKAKNILHIKISSTVLKEHSEEYTNRTLFMNPYNDQKSVEIRKAPHMYGWDILPRAVSAGLWRGVNLVSKNEVEFTQFIYNPAKYKYDNLYLIFAYELSCPYEILGKSKIKITATCKDQTFSVESPVKFHGGRIEYNIENPYLWWPKGYGEANLYDLTAEIICDGKVLATHREKMGLKTVKLETSLLADDKNGKFAFIINGEEVFCKGTNWVALDAFHSRDAERYDKALELLDDIGCNMVRMWGGNVYEDDAFYDFCDAHGIMVWQDFAMACNGYPHTEKFLKEIEKEAITIIKKLRNHACITLWSGDNECDSVLLDYYWTDPNANIITRDILKRAVFNHDFTKPYLPSSPYYSEEVFKTGDMMAPAENHLWGPRDYYKSRFYSESRAHFISETGYHGCPDVEYLEKFLEKEDLKPGAITENNILHSTDWDGRDHRVRLVSDQIIQMFGFVPDNMEDFALASQLSQAEAMKYFLERMRMRRPHKSGILWWNLIDGWPQVSDAVVGYYFDKKLAYYYLKQSQQPFCIMVDEIEDWNNKIIAANDTLKEVSGKVKITDADTNELIFEKNFTVPKNCSKALGEIRTMYSEHKLMMIEWEIEGKKFYNHYTTGQTPMPFDKCKEWVKKIKK